MSNFNDGYMGEKIRSKDHTILLRMADRLGVEPFILLGWCINHFEKTEVYDRMFLAVRELEEIRTEFPEVYATVIGPNPQ